MTLAMTLFCDLAGCKAHEPYDPETLIGLPDGWGELDFGVDHTVHVCSTRHALDWLMQHTADDGSWLERGRLSDVPLPTMGPVVARAR